MTRWVGASVPGVLASLAMLLAERASTFGPAQLELFASDVKPALEKQFAA